MWKIVATCWVLFTNGTHAPDHTGKCANIGAYTEQECREGAILAFKEIARLHGRAALPLSWRCTKVDFMQFDTSRSIEDREIK